jgi:acetyl esterase/lipase
MTGEAMRTEHDVSFGRGGGRSLLANVFAPDGAPETKTLVVLLHGGGWRVGSRAMMDPYAEALAARGYVAVAAEYRLLGESPWPAQADDVKTALAWARDNAARLGCLAERIVVQGFSAGGHLALIATADLIEQGVARPAAVVAFFPPAELVLEAPNDALARFAAMLLGDRANAEDARRASPVHRIGPGFPPTFLLHGGADWMVAPEASLNLYGALTRAGAPAELHIYAGHHHEFSGEPSMVARVIDEVDLFLRRMVVEPARFADETASQNMFAEGPEAFQKRVAAIGP